MAVVYARSKTYRSLKDNTSHQYKDLICSFCIGERYDFLVRANRPVANYWMKVIGLGDCLETENVIHAILRYDGAPDADPETDPF